MKITKISNSKQKKNRSKICTFTKKPIEKENTKNSKSLEIFLQKKTNRKTTQKMNFLQKKNK